MALSLEERERRRKRAARVALLNNPEALHFLHISKCAGTQIGEIISQINEIEGEGTVVKHGHDRNLYRLPLNARYFFSIREPISRFRSGFYSRKRKGQPRAYNEWSAYDEVAFTQFPHANDLAEALFDDGPRGIEATAAIKSIRHTAQNQVDWFMACGAFLTVREPVWIIRQSHFEHDLDHFLVAAGYGDLRDRIKPIADASAAHVFDYSGTPPLSEKAKANLRHWYAQDIQFYRMCEAWLDNKYRQCAMA